jgi:hypothetical protein
MASNSQPPDPACADAANDTLLVPIIAIVLAIALGGLTMLWLTLDPPRHVAAHPSYLPEE